MTTDATTDRLDELLEAMRATALGYPGTVEGISCAGTAIESRTVKAGKRAFLFLRRKEVRIKLEASLGEIQARAAQAPDQWEAGKGGWVKITLEAGAQLELEDARRWIEESYRLMANKTMLKQLDAASD